MSSEKRGRRGARKAGGPGSQQLSRPQGRNGDMDLENGLVYSPPSFSPLAMAIKEKK